MKTPAYLTLTQAAESRGIPVATLRRWCGRGLIRGAWQAGPRAWMLPENFEAPQLTPGRKKVEK